MSELMKPTWPGWETVGLIGRGSFGAVYKIRRDVLGDVEEAAMKVISIPQNNSDLEDLYSDGYDEESITSSFKSHLKSIVAEYSLMRKMNGCSNIVSCDDIRYVQHDDGIGWDIFIKMELLTPMAKVLPANLPDEEVLRIARDICEALVICKKYDVVHRDIKPQNIFVSPNGDYKLGDFGIAKTVEKTMGGTKIGTYKYMAPEVYNNQPYGTTADLYSLGLVLYWLLNQRRMPFLPLPPEKIKAGMEEESRLRRFSGEPLPPPVSGSDKLKKIVLKACAFDPKDRYSSAEEMLAELNDEEPGWNVPDPIPEDDDFDTPSPDPASDDVEPDAPDHVPEQEFVADSSDEVPQDTPEVTPEQNYEEVPVPDSGTTPWEQPAAGTSNQNLRKKWLPIIAAAAIVAVVVLLVLKPWTGWRTIDGKKYYFISAREKQTGMANIDGETYYFGSTGEMQTGWQTVDSKKYYFASDGVMQKGWVDFGTEQYFFGSDGTIQMRFETKGGKTYCYNSRGVVQTGWQTIGGKRYYFDTNGVMQNGWQTISGKKYFFDSDGVMLTGWTNTTSGERYYFDSDGIMQTGWTVIDGNTYFFQDNGVMLTGWTSTSHGEKYYFGTDGIMRTGWHTIDGIKFYFNEDGILQK